ncbi:transmembrane protein, putative (macronuclear) [Tetrahymena thermophila SB210]|uniref:Transmembrane protein, putative n=1 Tax=Tetrahymena thermophila (strain SB210) TaxID=312017 RepID=Q22P03_TETTS|nr:transmembrane protein, putative [Tetrahymena thermophila SB210]EAR87008.2 transmembrane protein, putative [Tetrahymena thermophila SB210]|eukprot:XP_001007253.2 transmembrane protein, putative [Tetrahymena thermophila SB210]
MIRRFVNNALILNVQVVKITFHSVFLVKQDLSCIRKIAMILSNKILIVMIKKYVKNVQTKAPLSTYCDANLICEQCTNIQCAKCEQNKQDCISCDNKYFYDKNCYNQQQPNTYCNNSKVCQQCKEDSCLTCDYVMINSLRVLFVMIRKYAKNAIMVHAQHDTCFSSQPENTYCDNQNICKTCQTPNCLKCDETLNQCKQCNPKYFLYESKCTSQQPINTYCDNNLICEICNNKDCAKCSNDKQKCISCENKYLYNDNCYVTQQPNTFCNNQKECQKCKLEECYFCDNQLMKCIKCYDNKYLFQGQCKSEEPSNTYCDKVTKICTKCSNDKCKECDNNLKSCTSCNSNQYFYNSECYEDKPNNTYCDNLKICKKCKDENCQSCDENLEKCFKCYKQTYIHEQKCYQQQPNNTFCNQSKECKLCLNNNCKTCDFNLTDCVSCLDNQYLFNKQCYITQPNSTFCDEQKVCQSCQSGCKVCKNNPYICEECIDQYYLFNGKCSFKQPDSTYCDKSTLVCNKCDETCFSCNGPTQNECTGCDQTVFRYDSSTSRCLCKEGGFTYVNTSQKCEKCKIIGCNDCYQDINKCIQCGEKMEFDKVTSECYCKDDLEIVNRMDNKCMKSIIPNCQKLVRNKYVCEKCIQGYEYDILHNKCNFCKNGKYADENGLCTLPCSPGCLKCSSLTNCVNVDPNYKPQKPKSDEDNKGEKDVEYTPPEKRIPLTDFSVCHISCLTCFGQNYNNCLKCSSEETRDYNYVKSTCNCKDGHLEVNKQECQQFTNLESAMLSSSQAAQFSSLALALPTCFLFQTPYIYYVIQTKQYLGLMSMNHPKNTVAEQVLSQFRTYNFNYDIPLTIITTSNKLTSDEINQLFISTLIISCFLITGLLFKYSRSSFRGQSYLRWNLFLLMARNLTSFNTYIVVKFLSQNKESIGSSEIAIFVFYCIILFIYYIQIALGIKNQIKILNDAHRFDSQSQNNSSECDVSRVIKNDFLEVIKFSNPLEEGVIVAKFHQKVSYSVITQGLNTQKYINLYLWAIIEAIFRQSSQYDFYIF